MFGVGANIETRPVGQDQVELLGQLFASERTTRHCWCMSFCTSRATFSLGWFGGGNKRRFEALADHGVPMGVLALDGGVPVGWAACGPRSRYLGTSPSRHPVLGARPRGEDESVWLLPCLFVHTTHRGQGVSHALVSAATALARDHGAVALEAWPLSGTKSAPADAFVGREPLFAELGFHLAERPIQGRAIMRLDLGAV